MDASQLVGEKKQFNLHLLKGISIYGISQEQFDTVKAKWETPGHEDNIVEVSNEAKGNDKIVNSKFLVRIKDILTIEEVLVKAPALKL